MRKALSVLLALCLLVGALPVFAGAADSDFVIENGTLTGYTGPGGKVTIPDGVTQIGFEAFNGNPLITKVTIPSSVRTIESNAFSNCEKLSEVVILEGTVTIKGNAFGDCYAIKSVTIPASVKEIADRAFFGDFGIKDVYYAGSEAQWKQIKGYGGVNQTPGTAGLEGVGATIHYNSTGSQPSNPTVGGFSDVKAKDYYADAVVWAVEKGITNGIGGGKFGPKEACRREQIVTFLWNDAGKPDPASIAAFGDMPKNENYQKAISWAAENNITSGYAGNIFRPGKTCNRAEAVTFIWRAHSSPEPTSTASFTDMPDITDFQKAISWAAENGILAGDGNGHCLPGKNCTRAEIVSFLYRARNL